ncbi:ubiquitin carboxyl-terminal hydrolase [Anaeramoeba flamelloides]|uniref:Ubiquitin carboxyl-terminal hydrolase n=1 Tax=Anaeramoeba flamelloides TaxID=1746091 RepID=A0ABQ8Y978_9EUKA|nr:ubiquitin carboxyl-terminal hydrolase [Anaeramoeba flamelloides]
MSLSNHLKDFGFTYEMRTKILEKKPKNLNDALEIAEKLNKEKEKQKRKNDQMSKKESRQLQSIIEKSLKTYEHEQRKQNNHNQGIGNEKESFESLYENDLRLALSESLSNLASRNNPYLNKRLMGTPVGLKNLGNTCFANSLLQTYFNIPLFRQAILSFPLEKYRKAKMKYRGDLTKENENDITFVIKLQAFFSQLLLTRKKYLSPTVIWKALETKTFKFGKQEDPTEFNDLLINKIETGFEYASKIINQNKRDKEGKYEGKKSITNLFTGEIVHIFRIPSNKINPNESNLLKNKGNKNLQNIKNSWDIINKKTETIGQIILPIGHNKKDDIISSFTRFTISELEYITEEKKTVQAQQISKFNKLPKVLIFQLQRVSFDFNSKKMTKDNSVFKFETEIYLDRFLTKNTNLYDIKNKKEKIIKEKIKLLKNELKEFKNFKSLGIPLKSLLQSSIDFVNDQIVNQQTTKIPNSDYFFQAQETKKFFQSEMDQMDKKYNKIKKKIEKEELRLKTLYDDLKNIKYQLFSMVIHSGVVNSGHYYTFVLDCTQDKWWKFNDQNVTQISENEVLQISTGEKKGTSAYCLIYVDTKFLQKMKVSNIGDQELIPNQLVDLVKQQNLVFKGQLDQYSKNNLKSSTKQKLQKFQDIFNIHFNKIKNSIPNSCLNGIQNNSGNVKGNEKGKGCNNLDKIKDYSLLGVIHYAIIKNEIQMANALLINYFLKQNLFKELNNSTFLKQIKELLKISQISPFQIDSFNFEYEIYQRAIKKFIFSLNCFIEGKIEKSLNNLILTYKEWNERKQKIDLILKYISIISQFFFKYILKQIKQKKFIGISENLDQAERCISMTIYAFGSNHLLLKNFTNSWLQLSNSNTLENLKPRFNHILKILNSEIQIPAPELVSFTIPFGNYPNLFNNYFKTLLNFHKTIKQLMHNLN